MSSEIDTILVGHLRAVAERGTSDGTRRSAMYLSLCRGDDRTTGARLMFTRDSGMHSCGWWKNPDYERCYHLSVSYSDRLSGEPRPQVRETTLEYLKAFFGDDYRLVWSEPPYTETGKKIDVWHFRLFCDEGWQAIKPRGEVYSKELTERGYKTFSELRYEEEKEAHEQ